MVSCPESRAVKKLEFTTAGNTQSTRILSVIGQLEFTALERRGGWNYSKFGGSGEVSHEKSLDLCGYSADKIFADGELKYRCIRDIAL